VVAVSLLLVDSRVDTRPRALRSLGYVVRCMTSGNPARFPLLLLFSPFLKKKKIPYASIYF
jgi:hypothetical protein